jgi:hypothetical protein
MSSASAEKGKLPILRHPKRGILITLTSFPPCPVLVWEVPAPERDVAVYSRRFSLLKKC